MSIINPYPEICLPYSPTAFSFTIVFGLCDISDDFMSGDKHSVKIICKMDSGNVIFESNDMPLDIPEDNKKRKIRGMQVSLEIRNAKFEDVGILKTSVLYDGEIIDEYEIPVVSD